MDKKEWYKSKCIWTSIVTILIALYNIAIKMGCGLPPIWNEFYIILGALGIYSRKKAIKQIGKADGHK